MWRQRISQARLEAVVRGAWAYRRRGKSSAGSLLHSAYVARMTIRALHALADRMRI